MAKDMRKLTVTECSTYGNWFSKFMKGMHKRMGDDVRPDRALSHEILVEIMKLVEKDWGEAPQHNKLKAALEGAFYLIAYCLALRGEEVPLVELAGIRKHWAQARAHNKPHIVIALLGRFKHEIGEGYHVMPVVFETPRGLEPGKWVERVLHEYDRKGIHSGYMFRNRSRQKIKASDMEVKFHERLEKVKELQPILIREDMDVIEEYGISRSFRRGATSAVTNQGAPEDVINENGRWRKVEKSGASRPGITIREHYTDIRLTVDSRLRFSEYL